MRATPSITFIENVGAIHESPAMMAMMPMAPMITQDVGAIRESPSSHATIAMTTPSLIGGAAAPVVVGDW